MRHKEPVMQNDTTHVGLDAHKKDHQVAMFLPDSNTPVEWTVPNTKRDVQRMVRRAVKKAPGPVVFCYEAGGCGFTLKRWIESTAAAVTCVVVAPSLIPVKPGEHIKTNRRDARKLGELQRAGLLTEVQAPGEAEEAVRDLVRCRDAAREDLMRARHRLLKFLQRWGLVYTAGRNWTQKHTVWLRGLPFDDPALKLVFERYFTEVSHQEDRVAQLTREVEAVAQTEPYREPVRRLCCFRGIDTLTAMTLVAELHSFGRFVSPRELMSYLGVTPSEHSTGNSRRRGGITKAGNRRVRRILVEAAWHQAKLPVVSKTLRKRREGQPAWVIAVANRALTRLHSRYCHLVCRGKLPTKAAMAVARELAGFIWAVLYSKGEAPPQLPAVAAESDPSEQRTTAKEFFASAG
jgi:transposase